MPEEKMVVKDRGSNLFWGGSRGLSVAWGQEMW